MLSWVSSPPTARLGADARRRVRPAETGPEVETEPGLRIPAVVAHPDLEPGCERAGADGKTPPRPLEPEPQARHVRRCRREVPARGLVTHSHSNDPLACAAGSATLDVLEEEDLAAQARRLGSYLKSKLHELAERFEIVGDVRGRGLLQGIELVLDRQTREPATTEGKEITERCLQKRAHLQRPPRRLSTPFRPTGEHHRGTNRPRVGHPGGCARGGVPLTIRRAGAHDRSDCV